MPLIKIDSSFLTVHPELSKRIEILNRISQSNGILKSYTEDYPQLEVLLKSNHPEREVSGYVSLGASVVDNGTVVAEMEVIAAFEDLNNTPLFINDGDYVIAKCPPNDRPLKEGENASQEVLIMGSKSELLEHLNLNG